MRDPNEVQDAKPMVLPSLASAREVEFEAAIAGATRASAAHIAARQSMFLTASGSLIQFNAIMAAIHGSVLATTDQISLKASFATALLLHVLAAFILCWAARPIDEAPSTARGITAYSDDLGHANDTFHNYRRGWRMTLLALTSSAVVAALFVLRAFGLSPF
jgi:hypothetical protein